MSNAKLSNEILEKLTRAYLEIKEVDKPTLEEFIASYVNERKEAINDIYNKHLEEK